MRRIIIDITDNSETIVTYENEYTTYPICKVDPKEFNISKETCVDVLTLISNVVHRLGTALRYQLIKQGFVNSALNKPSDSK